MAEARVGFLCDLASTLARNNTNQSAFTILRSYYLLRCKTAVGGNALPDKQFSSKVRCPKCCIEWSKNTAVKVRPLKLSKKQKRKIKSLKQSGTKDCNKKPELLNSNEIEQICTFCSSSTVITALKPKKNDVKSIQESKISHNSSVVKLNDKKATERRTAIDSKSPIVKKKTEINVYSNTKDVFSLKNQGNTLDSSVKEQPKVIKNCKRKKDRYAGLCQAAVLASAKLKEEKGKQSMLNLFLKPSTSR